MVELYREAATSSLRAGSGARVEPLSDLAVSLVGSGGYVPPDVQQALLAVSTRPPLRRPVFGALVRAYRLDVPAAPRVLARRDGAPAAVAGDDEDQPARA